MSELDFLIVGAQKSGSTSLRAFLGEQEKDIFVLNRELHFWNRKGQYQDGAGLNAYLENFAEAKPNQIKGEKSPSYLVSQEAPERIHKHFPKVKIIAILRNPIDRAYSAYWHGRRVGAIESSTTFGEAVRNYKVNQGKPYGDMVTAGFYSQQIARYLNFFPLKQLHVISFESTLTQSGDELHGVLKFLLPNSDIANAESQLAFPKRNVARASRFPKLNEAIFKSKFLSYSTKSRISKKSLVELKVPEMLEDDRKFLQDIYGGENQALQSILSKNFGWKI
jgi:Sulfotransferase domain